MAGFGAEASCQPRVQVEVKDDGGGYFSTLCEALTHAVVVVLADEEHGQVPQRRDVERLEQLPLVRCTITVPAQGQG